MTKVDRKKLDEGRESTQKTERLSVANTVIKFCLDQSLGSSVNTVLFIIVMGLFRRLSWSQILANIQQVY